MRNSKSMAELFEDRHFDREVISMRVRDLLAWTCTVASGTGPA